MKVKYLNILPLRKGGRWIEIQFFNLFHLKISWLLAIILLVGCYSCKHPGNNVTTISGDTMLIKYSKGFKITKSQENYYIEVYNPWQKASSVSVKYILGPKPPKKLNDNEVFIKTPVRKVVCMSTTHIAFLDILHELSTIQAVSGTNFVNNPQIIDEIKKGKVLDIGYEQNLNFELVASLQPDLVFAYSVGSEVSGLIAKLKTMNIPVVIIAEYLENVPLAKAEWVKFFATFYNKEVQGDSIFNSIESQYLEVKELAQNAKERPMVMSSLPWNGTWYISGGQTYMGKLIEDANGDYIWKRENSRESLPMDYEYVFQKSVNADVWLNLGSCMSIQNVLETDSRLSEFKAIKTKMLFNNNARTNASGGNDYWESGTINPHIILKDLISIFHPSLLPNHQLYYYQKLK